MKNTQELVRLSKELILKYLPRVNKVDFKFEDTKDGQIVAKVKVHTKGKTLWAKKKGVSYKDTLNKAISAILKQHHRKKRKRPANLDWELSPSH